MQALTESKNTSRRQPGTGGSNEGASSKPEVLDESTIVSATSSKGTGTKPGVLDEDNDITEEKVILEWGDEQDSEFIYDDDDEKDDKYGDADDEDDETQSDENEIYKYKIRVRNEEDVEMKDVKVEESDKGFGDQFLKLSSNSSLVSTIKDSADADSHVLTVVDSYLDTKVRDVFQKDLQKHTADLIHTYSLPYLPELSKKPTPTSKQEYEKSPSEILMIKKEQSESQKNPQLTIKSTEKAALKEYDLKSTLYQSMHANKSINRNPANHRLYHALMEALIEYENVMDKGVAYTVKDHKRKHDDDDEDPSAGPNQSKKTKRRRTKESES
uniref:Uncharacterized protein n=1 Tax=Tanacetum cinerariifolium TaxID=118510 RepID=A0A6L2KQ62_TANCI|nr:hypothetical protein [Tanacetum cinerariifolium]